MEIIDTRSLFHEITESLFTLIHSLKPDDWNAATCYPNWTVKDIVTHLIQTGSSRLSRQRDGYPSSEQPTTMKFSVLSDLIAQSNRDWTALLKDISPPLLLDFLKISENQLSDFLSTQELPIDAFYPVAWAGEGSSPNWFDIAREFTEWNCQHRYSP